MRSLVAEEAKLPVRDDDAAVVTPPKFRFRAVQASTTAAPRTIIERTEHFIAFSFVPDWVWEKQFNRSKLLLYAATATATTKGEARVKKRKAHGGKTILIVARRERRSFPSREREEQVTASLRKVSREPACALVTPRDFFFSAKVKV